VNRPGFESLDVLILKVEHKRANNPVIHDVDLLSYSLLNKICELSVAGHLHHQLDDFLLLLLSKKPFKIVLHWREKILRRYTLSS